MMAISGTTMLLGIFGDPIAHTLSPVMQNAALQAVGIDAVYVPFRVTSDHLPAAVASLAALGVRGVNVTIPHKEAVLPLLDEVEGEARLIGAVNTIVQQDGRLIGYNTDAPGFLRAVEDDLGFSGAERRALLLGAGGAARAAAVALACRGVAALDIANRSLPRAEQLAQELRMHFPDCTVSAVAMDDKGLHQRLAQADLLVNTTSIGLHGESFSPELLEHLAPDAMVYDMVYRRRTSTPLVQNALAAGRKAADGLGMLAAQGEEAFRLWIGSPPPAGLMKNCLLAECLEK